MKTGSTMIIFYIMIGLIHITSCNPPSKNDFAKFPIEVDMGSVRVEEIRIDNCFSPTDIFVHDSVMLINDLRDENMFLKIYNSQTGDFINGFGAIGNGPNEFINPSLFKVYPHYDAFWLMEPPKRLIHRIPLNQMISEAENGFTPNASIQLQNQMMMITDYHQMSDTTLLVYNPTGDNLFAEMDINGKIVRTYGNNNNKKISENHIANIIYNRGIFTIHNNKAFLFYNLLNKITRFDFETMDRSDRLGNNFTDIKPEVHASGNLLNNYTSFASHAISFTNLIFIAYKGGQSFNEEDMRPNYANTILVFDEHTNPVAKLNFPFGILNLTICNKGMLYTIPDSFDGTVYKYDLAQIPNLNN
ncbi:BF3164 family lipoprotein [Perlabentimonas gracilis]|uniref:BF3164 family lipoprotein n=1 Tax=Perlabentimonas gracilis TaxID=2715279 RepID=UPI00140C5A45|nr:BF3164 family lipoprotein [Perlabentimonas gracilis]NHB69260.1 hypothetical protein [Perlabentimonas gracilis]